MKRFSASILGVCFGAAGFVLRLLQNRTGFEPDTGLPVPGNIPALALPVLLVLAAVVSLCFMCNRNGRTLFVGRCGISYIFRFSLKMAVHG